MRDKTGAGYGSWMWLVCWALVFGGAWLDDHFRNHWFALVSVLGCVGCFYVRTLEIRHENEKRINVSKYVRMCKCGHELIEHEPGGCLFCDCPGDLEGRLRSLEAANRDLCRELAEVRHQRDYAEQFKAAIWAVTTPCEPDTCILTLKEMGATEAKDRLAPAFLAGAKWWEFESTGATMWQSDQQAVFAEALKRYPFLSLTELVLKRERDELAARLEIALKALRAAQANSRLDSPAQWTVPD